MMLRDLKNRIISRPNPYTLPEWKLPFFPRSCGETTSILDTEIHGGGEKTFVQINWCTSGCGQVSIDGGDEFTVRTGDVFYSCPATVGKMQGRRLRGSSAGSPSTALAPQISYVPMIIRSI